MPHRSEKYARQAIAASGLAILDPRIAFELRPDLWASAQDCRITFRRAQKFEGTHRVTATIEDYGDVLVCTRSLDALEQRIQWIAGRRVLAVKPAEADAVPPPCDPSTTPAGPIEGGRAPGRAGEARRPGAAFA